MNVDKFGRYRYTGMTIDKFGRHTARERLRGPKGEGFKLTQDGSYDMENKRLANVSDPLLETDGANLKTLQTHLSSCMKLNSNELFDAQHKRIGNTGDPLDADDVVTKGYFDSNTPFRFDHSLSYSFHQYRLQDLGAPVKDGDAVNLNYIKNETLGKKDGNWDFGDKRLTQVGKPFADGDAVNKAYLNTHTPIKSKKGFNCSGQRLLMVGPPEDISDAINLEYLRSNSLVISTDAESKWTDGKYDAKDCRISNLAKPLDLDDAISKRYLKTVLSELAYAIYKNINQKARIKPVPAEQWMSKVMESTWDDLFNGEYSW